VSLLLTAFAKTAAFSSYSGCDLLWRLLTCKHIFVAASVSTRTRGLDTTLAAWRHRGGSDLRVYTFNNAVVIAVHKQNTTSI
jgi:hypothetical protein